MWLTTPGLADIRAFEDAIRRENIDLIPLLEWFDDFSKALPVLRGAITRGRILKTKERASFFLDVLSTSIQVNEGGVAKCFGGSLLYSWVAMGEVEEVFQLVDGILGAGASLEQEYFVNALFRDVHIISEHDVRVSKNIFLLLTGTEKGLIFLNKIVRNAISVFLHDDRRARETTSLLLRKFPDPMNKNGYETPFENLVSKDAGITILEGFQDARITFSNIGELVAELLRKVNGKTLLKLITLRRNGNPLILSWLTDTKGVLFHLSKKNMQELLLVIKTIQPQELARCSEKFAKMLTEEEVDGEIPLSHWIKTEEARQLLVEMYQNSILSVRTKEMLVIFSSLYPDKFEKKKNKLRVLLSESRDMELCIKLLKTGVIKEGEVLYNTPEQFLADVFEFTESDLPLLYCFSEEKNMVDGQPMLGLLFSYTVLINKSLKQFAKALLVKSEERILCAIDLLLGYKEGQDCLIQLITAIPGLFIALLKEDVSSIFLFSGNKAGRECFSRYIQQSSSIMDDADTLMSALEYKNGEAVAFNELLYAEEGSGALYQLMQKNPDFFKPGAYMSRWALLFGDTVKYSELQGFSIMACLSLTKNGCRVIGCLVKNFPDMLRLVFVNIFQVVDSCSNEKNGYNALAGLLDTDEGVDIVVDIFLNFPISVSFYSEDIQKALVSKFVLRGYRYTAMTFLMGVNGRRAFYTLCLKYNNFFQMYKETLLNAACIHSDGIAWVADGIFSPVFIGGQKLSLLSFLIEGEAWFLCEILKGLAVEGVPKPQFNLMWETLTSPGSDKVYNIDRFSRNEKLSNILKRFLDIKFNIPSEFKKTVLDVLRSKSSLGLTIREKFNRYPSGRDILAMIDSKCKGIFDKATSRLSGMSIKTKPEVSIKASGVLSRCLSGDSLQSVPLSDEDSLTEWGNLCEEGLFGSNKQLDSTLRGGKNKSVSQWVLGVETNVRVEWNDKGEGEVAKSEYIEVYAPKEEGVVVSDESLAPSL